MISPKEYKKKVISIGCIITGRQAECHHVKSFINGYGRVSDFLIIPICPELHTMNNDSIHKNKSLFEDRYGREIDLLAKTIQIIATQGE